MKAKAYSTTGKARAADVELPGGLFDGTINEGVLHQVITAYRANRRQGTHSTKTRNEVRGGGRKPWRQKGTGRARQGSIRAAQWRGGSIVFGPQPRSYRTHVPKQMRRLAIQSALNARASDGALLVIEPLEFDEPRTRRLIELLEALEIQTGNVLILTDGVKTAVYLSARNVPGVQVCPWGEASAYDVLWSDVLIVEESALSGSEAANATEQGDES